MRMIVEDDPVAFCDWLDIRTEHPVRFLRTGFASETLHADLLVQVGPRRLVQVEYMRSPTADFAVRMVGYRAQIMRRYPRMSLSQYAIILGDGHVQSCDDPENGFHLGLRNIYLPEHDAEEFLSRPGLAALSVLARGDEKDRGHFLKAAVELTRTLPDDKRMRLVEAMLVLATITLDRTIIDLIAEEAGMTIETVTEFYAGTKMGQALQQKSLEQGREQGREEGREQGSARTLSALLRVRFGDDPQIPAIAERLAHAANDEASIRAITAATTLDDLLV